MKSPFAHLATEKYRWFALIALSMGLAIVIIDNSVLNVAIPYILRDLHTSIDAIQWIISGYALIIGTLLITMGRIGDIIGRKKLFLIGTVLFAIGSFIASFAPNAFILFMGEAVIEAIGAAMMFTSSLSLLVSEFHGKERAIAFGVWGSVAGASSAVGPLLGGYLTSYYSWRWSLRINVFVAIATLLASVFIIEAKGEGKKEFDWGGMIYSGLGLFLLVFGLIEGRKYGWISPNQIFSIGPWTWPFTQISIIPVVFLLSVLLLAKFVIVEYLIEEKGGSPVLKMSLFKHVGFTMGLITLGILSLGQFGLFFIVTIYLQSVLGLDAFRAGVVFLSMSATLFVFGPVSGFLASKIKPRWVVTVGMFVSALSVFLLRQQITTMATGWTLAPALGLFGVGLGMCTAQLTNVILSAVPVQYAGEASAVNATVRQVGTAIGIAVIGVVMATSLNTNIQAHIQADSRLPDAAKTQIIAGLSKVSVESGQKSIGKAPSFIQQAVKQDVNDAFVQAVRSALDVVLVSAFIGALVSFSIPSKIKKSVGSD